jgi:hypothetical protein
LRLSNDFPRPFAEHAPTGISNMGGFRMRPRIPKLKPSKYKDGNAHDAFLTFIEKLWGVPKGTRRAAGENFFR